ncbi:hypothetical protein ACXZ1K_06120 [Pedobacter sp. PWIIR3]
MNWSKAYFIYPSISVLWMTLCIQGSYGQKINYEPVSEARAGKLFPLSPDPLVNMKWASPKATDELEVYHLKPVSLKPSSAKMFTLMTSVP